MHLRTRRQKDTKSILNWLMFLSTDIIHVSCKDSATTGICWVFWKQGKSDCQSMYCSKCRCLIRAGMSLPARCFKKNLLPPSSLWTQQSAALVLESVQLKEFFRWFLCCIWKLRMLAVYLEGTDRWEAAAHGIIERWLMFTVCTTVVLRSYS